MRELTSGNVPLGRFIRVMTRPMVEEPRRKLGILEVFLVRPGDKRTGIYIAFGQLF